MKPSYSGHTRGLIYRVRESERQRDRETERQSDRETETGRRERE